MKGASAHDQGSREEASFERKGNGSDVERSASRHCIRESLRRCQKHILLSLPDPTVASREVETTVFDPASVFLSTH